MLKARGFVSDVMATPLNSAPRAELCRKTLKARAFVSDVKERNGSRLDIFRLSQDDTDDWPHEEWWWDVLAEFMVQ